MDWMRYALELAKKGLYSCPPNPMVGCVIIKGSKLVGQGFHKVSGGPHAEVIALEQAQEHAEGAEVYLTLEPCAHYGRTPPCVDALIKARVKRVFVALLDPNPQVKGKGLKKLANAGIEVHLSNDNEAYMLNEDFFLAMSYQRPFVIAKWAMTLDGKIANAQGQSKWISSESARAHAHSLRAQVCGVMVGAQTVRLDNPMLDVRHMFDAANVRQPRPIVITRVGDMPWDRYILETQRRPIVITSERASQSFIRELVNRNIEHYVFGLYKEQISMKEVLQKLFSSCGIKSLLVEGGAGLLTALHEERLINQFYVYISPKLMGGKGSRTSLLGIDLNSIADIEELHSQKLLYLAPDLCFIAKSRLSPKSYPEFLKCETANV